MTMRDYHRMTSSDQAIDQGVDPDGQDTLLRSGRRRPSAFSTADCWVTLRGHVLRLPPRIGSGVEGQTIAARIAHLLPAILRQGLTFLAHWTSASPDIYPKTNAKGPIRNEPGPLPELLVG